MRCSELAGLRFAQTGLAAETYADTPGELEHVLKFMPPHPRLPMVHLNRGINLLNEQSRATVMEFASRFAGRVGGLVVHDQRDMGDQTDRLLTVLRELNARLCERPDSPFVFLEYAAHLEPAWFVELAEKLQDAERVSCCIDIGHLGIRQASTRFARSHPGLNLRDLTPGDARLPELAADVQDAVGGAVGDVLDVTRAIGRLGKRLHFHLHDAHPLIPGLADHFSFLLRLPDPVQLPGPPVAEHDVRARTAWPPSCRRRSRHAASSRSRSRWRSTRSKAGSRSPTRHRCSPTGATPRMPNG